MKFASFATFVAISTPTYAAELASCSNPEGKGYYAETGIITAKDSGWNDERITGGLTKLSKHGDDYDLIYVDVRQEIVSAREEGARIMLLSRGISSLSVLVVYPGKTAEVYTFLKTSSGKLEYIHTLSRAGDEVLITKASVMRGECRYINFDAI
ncbi:MULTISPECIES: hypothetical protein [Xanthomonas]|uniref:Secreted protein n=2 Tax=Xanthomonas TaxID=338 RepID=A0A7Z7IWB8_XANCH|nr:MULTISPECIES: hypothetical protein [Xanthomonas]ATS36825.1 hypothetical protein XcfCFBP6988P_00595 [Xanthomonas citri pv. phaseoli var. fuscans]ATS44365.1 hypothetical protein XcfCFBP6989P_19870 [Xanthomonas citri pv. phaseoli var. fuscans]ATS48720.1 hypothetical protein XcfCFBP6990P_20260 [Xanthomonas citri pv. phaseoli var. fuscans]ATS84901.1 hypothetical protein XcfCFBP6991P_13975 [Xanthomonas citri pv. phaseoli var. fuscans]QWN22330.1 hypothetical protein DGM98_21350 [Xanthomonas citri]